MQCPHNRMYMHHTNMFSLHFDFISDTWLKMLVVYYLVILALILLVQSLKRFFTILRVPGPILPNDIKGSLQYFLAEPRKFGIKMISLYGPLYRYILNSVGSNPVRVFVVRDFWRVWVGTV
jgi:hypothetical protein